MTEEEITALRSRLWGGFHIPAMDARSKIRHHPAEVRLKVASSPQSLTKQVIGCGGLEAHGRIVAYKNLRKQRKVSNELPISGYERL